MFLTTEKAFLATEPETGWWKKKNPRCIGGLVIIFGSVVFGFVWIMDN
jgi:hypothetical protein